MADRALLVGINRYPDMPLDGCVNDVSDMAEFLVAKCGFAAKNIRLLVDGRATKKNIRARLTWLVKGAKKGDRIVFHYSGHGTQVPTRDAKGEVDGYDEVIVPIDFDWDDEDMIRDDELGAFFAKLPVDARAVWIADCCHSGTLYRDFRRPAAPKKGRPKIKLGKSRFLPQPLDIRWRMRSLEPASKPRRYVRPNVTLISGCKDNQTSADAWFNDRANGALSYYLLELLHGKTPVPLKAMIESVRKNLKTDGFDQIPQLEGPAKLLARTFLGA
jgi:hypothetical protein